jgi:SNF2 family DNA or RNA helicase
MEAKTIMEFKKGQRWELTVSMNAGVQRWGAASIEAEIMAVTDKAVLVKAHAKIGRSDYCFRCKKYIENPVSRLVGYGPDCSQRLGIPRDATPEQARQIIANMPGQLRETWLPRSVIQDSELLKDITKKEKAVQAAEQVERTRSAYKLYVKKNRIYAKTPFTENHLVKDIMNARWDGTEKAWSYPASSETAEQLMASFMKVLLDPSKGLEHDDVVAEEFSELVKQNITKKSVALHKRAQDLPEIPKTRFKAWLHQKQAFWFAEQLKGVMLAMDMGTGKTKVSVDLVVNRGHMATVIFCPKSVIMTWQREFPKHAPEGFEIEVLGLDEPNKTVKKKAEMAKAFVELQRARNKPFVLVMNYDAAWREPMDDFLLKQKWDCMIVDESHKSKAPGGKFSMFASRLADRTEYRICLTGTPLAHSPLDAYAQYRILDKGVFGTSYQAFKSRFAILDQWGGFIRPANEDEFNQRFYSIAYRVTKDVLDLPPTKDVPLYCRLSSKAMKVYKQLEKDFVAEIEGGTVTAANALAKLLRLQQITSGYLPLDETQDSESSETAIVDTAKQDALEELLEGMEDREPVVIFSRFTYDLDRIKETVEKMGRTYAELSGRKSQLSAWQEGKFDVIGVQIQSGGAGIDLTRSRYSVYYSVGHSLGDYLQSRARTDRPGQTRPTTMYHIIAQGTVDEKVYAALESREEVIKAILVEGVAT